MVVLHYTGMASAEAAIARLCEPAAQVSAHYVIEQAGVVHRLVAEEHRAWHAGVSNWGGRAGLNGCSIGIEMVNPGHAFGYQPFPAPQMAALEALLGDILQRHAIPPERVVGHACIAPDRKDDPGEKFDWRRLALGGLSVWLDPLPAADGPADAARFQAAARRFGYPVPDTGEWCAGSLDVWRAFVRRFLPARIDRAPDPGAAAHLERLAAAWPACAGY